MTQRRQILSAHPDARPRAPQRARGQLRRARAVQAACMVARRYGIDTREPRVLSDCNNTVVHLVPLPLVAKVRSTTERGDPAPLRTELEIGLHLARAGAPVAVPSTELPARMHLYPGHALTFWRYQEHDPVAIPDQQAAGRALRECHLALETYPGQLPSFISGPVRRAGRVVAECGQLPALPAADQIFLADMHARLTAGLADRRMHSRILHGDPHRGNLLVSAAGIVLTDFESACTGPLEWDLSALPGGGADQFADLDRQLLTVLSMLRSLCVAVWCWQRPGRAPQIDYAARLDLSLLRQQA